MEDLFKKGKRTTLIAGGGTFFFALAKGLIGFFSGSVVLLGDAVHSAADSVSTALAWFGLRIAQKEPTDKFPYGFYKVENVTALFISFLIFYAAFHIIKESIGKLSVSYQLEIPALAISIAALDGIVMFLIGTYEIKSGKEINSQSLIADGSESRLHLLSSSIVVMGLIAALLNIPYLEGIAGIIIAFFIIEAGYEALKDAIFALMDVSPSEEVEQKVKKVLDRVSGIQGYNNLRLRKSGPFVFGEVEAKVRKSLNVTRAHEISKSIGEKVKDKASLVDSFSVKFVPYQTDRQKICVPIEENENLSSKISSHFGRAKKFALLDVVQGEVKDLEIIENPHRRKEKRAGLAVSEMLLREKIDSIVVKEIGPISFHTLRDNIVNVYKAKGNIDKIVSDFDNGKLKPLEKATRDKV